jgi:formylglycine-generating enzyme required for sulfatase activity
VVAITVNADSDAPPIDVEVAPEHRPQVQTITLSHPVEMVNWSASSELMADHGLMLPLSSQWEYGCRAGSTTIWWSGNDASDLVDIANVLDQRAARAIQGSGRSEAFDDGYVLHASVGSLKANGFGLYDVHGNVREWCRDKAGSSDRVERGGSFGTSALHGRSAWPNSEGESYRGVGLGLRPARALRLPD